MTKKMNRRDFQRSDHRTAELVLIREKLSKNRGRWLRRTVKEAVIVEKAGER
jgi:hypothetical protein